MPSAEAAAKKAGCDEAHAGYYALCNALMRRDLAHRPSYSLWSLYVIICGLARHCSRHAEISNAEA